MASEPVYEEKNNDWWKWLLGLLLLGGLLYLLFAASDEVDDNVVVDPVPVVDTTDDLVDNQPIVAVAGDNVVNANVVVEEVISDRLFRVTGTNLPAEGSLLYLDDSLDLDAAETNVDVNEGDRLQVSGEYRNDLDSQTLEADESNVVNVDPIVLVVTDIDFN